MFGLVSSPVDLQVRMWVDWLANIDSTIELSDKCVKPLLFPQAC